MIRRLRVRVVSLQVEPCGFMRVGWKRVVLRDLIRRYSGPSRRNSGPILRRFLAVPSGKFRYEALALKYCIVIFHDSTQRHTNPTVMYVHDLLKYS